MGKQHRKTLYDLPDGAEVLTSGAALDAWKYTCRVCGLPFSDTVPPKQQTDPICHWCFTGAKRSGPVARKHRKST